MFANPDEEMLNDKFNEPFQKKELNIQDRLNVSGMFSEYDGMIILLAFQKKNHLQILQSNFFQFKIQPLRRFMTEVIIISRSKFPAVDRFLI